MPWGFKFALVKSSSQRSRNAACSSGVLMRAKGRFGKQDFVYLIDEDMYRCPVGEKLVYHYTNQE